MRYIITLFLLSISLMTTLNAEDSSAVKNEVSVDASKEQEKPVFVKVSDVPENAVKVLSELKKIQEESKEVKETKEMHQVIESYADSVDILLKNKNYKNIKKQNLRELQKMHSELAVYLKQLEEWKELLKSRIDIYDESRGILSGYSSLWSQTHINAISKDTPEEILQHITSVIVKIEELSNTLKDKYDKTLIDSQIVTTKILLLKEISISLKKNEAVVKNRVFYQNQAPFFELLYQEKFATFSYVHSIKKTLDEEFYEIKTYFLTNEDLLVNFLIINIFISIFIYYFNYLYRKEKLFVMKESFYKKSFFFLARPFSVFFIFMMLIIIVVFPQRPASVIDMQLLIVLIPIVRVLQTIVDKQYYKYMYIFFSLYLLFFLDNNSADHELESRIFILLINISLFIYIAHIFIRKILSIITNSTIVKIFNYILVIYMALLFISFISNFYGTVLLTSRILEGIFLTIYASMVFYTIYIMLAGYVVIILRRRISSASNILDKYAKNIENTTKLLIKLFMLSWWFLIIVKVIGAYSFLLVFKKDVLAFSWKIAELTISVQSIFDFVFIVFTTWAVSKLLRTILEVEVFSRFTLPRGMPTAILTTLNYLIIITGTILAFASLGVSAQQFALIFGALGVGIGFGLRNIIANFVSGIIMVFERPVQIGDTIEVDKTMGSVLGIGARSSTVKTFDGAEVIIPNADFISKEIVNWTLSDEFRRKTVNLKVDFDSDIDVVLDIMKSVASKHEDVLKEPEPLATFQGFGDYYLEFKLYFWLSQNLIVAQSEVAIGIYKELKKAGVKMPTPKTIIKE